MTDKALKKIGNNLRKARIARNLTQEDVAQKANITTNYYAMLERGQKNPSTTVITAIIKALGIDYSDILGK